MNTSLTPSQQKRHVICTTKLKFMSGLPFRNFVRSTKPGMLRMEKRNIVCFDLTVCPISGWIYVWMKHAFKSPCVAPTVKHSGGSVIFLDTMSWKSLGTVIALDSDIAANKYEAILQDQLHHMVFDEHLDLCLPCPPQSPDLNIIEPLREVLEPRLRI